MYGSHVGFQVWVMFCVRLRQLHASVRSVLFYKWHPRYARSLELTRHPHVLRHC
jgi:hypothetical protein